MLFKPYRYGTALQVITEEDKRGSGSEHYDVGQRVSGSWRTIETIDLLGDYKKRDYDKNNMVTRLVLNALSDLAQNPEIYIVGTPDSESKAKSSIQHPSTMRGLAKDIGRAVQEGKPPFFFRLMVTGPQPSEVENIVNFAHAIWKKGWEAYKAKSKDMNDGQRRDAMDKLMDLAQTHTNDYARKTLSGKRILNWIELKLKTVQQYKTAVGENPTKFEFQQVGVNVGTTPRGYSSLKVPANISNKLKMTNEYAADNLKDLRDAILDVFYSETWAAFKYWVEEDKDGFVHEADEVLNTTPVRMGYDKAKGRSTETRHTVKHREPIRREKGEGPLKVVGSVFDTGSTIGTMIVTANESERLHQNSQGVFVPPPELPRQVGASIPESSVKAWAQSDKYKAIFGMYIDHPLIVPVRNRQVYWYSEEDMFYGAVLQYATMTGDSPSIAYRIFNKTGSRAGITITRSELNKDSSLDGSRFRTRLTKVLEAFSRHVKDGKQLYEAKVAKWMGPDVEIPQNVYASMPRVPEGLDPEGFTKYVEYVRKQTTTTLGLNFRANWPQMYKTTAGKLARLPYHTHQIVPTVQALHKRKHLGKTNEQGKVVEPSGIYLIEYLLAHGRYGRTAETYMIPLNVIRADEDYKPMYKPTRMNKSELQRILMKSFGQLNIVRDMSAWTYIPPSLSQDLPFSRLVRPSVVFGSEVPEINKRLPSRFKRTPHGYYIDGIMWYAYQMFIVMPPSVAHEQLGLIHKNAYRKLIIDDPNAVDRLRRGVLGKRRKLKDFGVTPFARNTEFIEDPKTLESQPYAKASQRGIKIADVVGDSSKLDLDWLFGRPGRVWEPKFEEAISKIHGEIERHIVGYTNARTPEEQVEWLHKYQDTVKKLGHEVEFDLSQYMQGLEANQRANSKNRAHDLSKAVSTYIRYVKQEISSTGHHITVPQLVEKLGLSIYEAYFGSVEGRTLEYSIKAPSASVAKYLILLRLLRRSATNKELGRAMNIRSARGTRRIFPDHNARVLAHWAKTGFEVIEQQDPKGIYRVGEKRHLEKDELRRGEIDSQHRYARWVRTD